MAKLAEKEFIKRKDQEFKNILFHGTQAEGIKQFEPGKANLGEGTYFTKRPEQAIEAAAMQRKK